MRTDKERREAITALENLVNARLTLRNANLITTNESLRLGQIFNNANERLGK